MFPTALALTGVLITYSRGSEIGRERYSDDQKTLHSEITMAGQKLDITLERKPGRATVILDGKTVTHDVPAGTLALANGHWQAYSLVAEQYPEAKEPIAVKVLLPGQGITLDGKLRVLPRPDHGRHIELTIGPLTVEVDLAQNGAVTHAAVPLQNIEVRPEGAAKPESAAPRQPPAGILEEPITLERTGATMRGVLWRPAHVSGKLPVALLIVGSGPTDRDGNSTIGLNTDCYRQLAESLAQTGIASVRYDKRGIATSSPVPESALSLDEYAADASALIAKLRADARFSKVTLIGHSEGGLVALASAAQGKPDALVLISTAGRPLWQVLHDQMAKSLKSEELASADQILGALRDGKPVAHWPAELAMMFRPSMENLWRSELPPNPRALLAKLTMPVTIVQGETDAQVTIEDARRLATARKDAHLVLLPRVNHVLKEEASPLAAQQSSYTDPKRPLGPGVAAAVQKGVAR